MHTRLWSDYAHAHIRKFPSRTLIEWSSRGDVSARLASLVIVLLLFGYKNRRVPNGFLKEVILVFLSLLGDFISSLRAISSSLNSLCFCSGSVSQYVLFYA